MTVKCSKIKDINIILEYNNHGKIEIIKEPYNIIILNAVETTERQSHILILINVYNINSNNVFNNELMIIK